MPVLKNAKISTVKSLIELEKLSEPKPFFLIKKNVQNVEQSVLIM